MKKNYFLFLSAFAAIIIAMSSCSSRDERLYVDATLNADSLKTMVSGEYVVPMKGYTLVNNKMDTCSSCSHFMKYMILKDDFTWKDSTVFTKNDSVIESRNGRWEFVNKNVVALKSTDEVEIILEKDSTNQFLRVFRFKGQIIPLGEQPLYVRRVSEPESGITEEISAPAGELYFKALGNEPFWNIQVFNEDAIHESTWLRYTPMEGEPIEALLPLGILLEDGGGNFDYYSQDRKTHLKVRNDIASDGMSDKVYYFKVDFKTENVKVSGVGEFADARRNMIIGKEEVPATEGKIKASSIYRKWMLKTIDGKPYQSNKPAFIYLLAQSFTGNTGCNDMFGKMSMKNNEMTFSTIGANKMACMNMDENAFLGVLEGTHTFTLTENQFVLTTKKGQKLSFRAE